MTVEQIMDKVYTKLNNKDFSGTEGKLAVQVNLTGKVGGVFYIEILDGVLSVMPYEYIDKDAAISVTMTNLDKILSGKLKASVAIAESKMKVEGNIDKVLLLDTLLQQ
ncbi:SCP2 sterol-binding domain-containing protein [Intestinibacillus massiliensis]|uniref:SCP2 sterol-binding domain-containing protein n=1 Tax=Intestinibacillus massiliensis TaxID=1871029 RepID=UPI000B350CB4|nr:SCP2 sterol-binding domain-containing protein [Intestinibacillus massiliensis]MCB6365468.1 SCP2 sterol-binding domain-containing protein [Intestinibacillus massiliensis]